MTCHVFFFVLLSQYFIILIQEKLPKQGLAVKVGDVPTLQTAGRLGSLVDTKFSNTRHFPSGRAWKNAFTVAHVLPRLTRQRPQHQARNTAEPYSVNRV